MAFWYIYGHRPHVKARLSSAEEVLRPQINSWIHVFSSKSDLGLKSQTSSVQGQTAGVTPVTCERASESTLAHAESSSYRIWVFEFEYLYFNFCIWVFVYLYLYFSICVGKKNTHLVLAIRFEYLSICLFLELQYLCICIHVFQYLYTCISAFVCAMSTLAHADSSS